MVQVPPASLLSWLKTWSLKSAGCMPEGSGCLWESCSATKPALQALAKAKAVFGTRNDPSYPSVSSRDKLCSLPLISRSQWAVPSAGFIPWAGCIPLCAFIRNGGQDGCWEHHLPQAAHWEQVGWPCPLSTSKFIQLQNRSSRKLNLWAKLLPKSKVVSLLLVVNNKHIPKAL